MKRIAYTIRPDGSGLGTCRVEWTESGPRLEAVESDRWDEVLVPGFCDVHIHGAHGLDMMTAGHAGILELADRLADEGYEAFLPTTITADAGAVREAVASLPVDHPMIPGFHLEGPFISPRHPGAQPPEAIAEAPAGPGRWDSVLEHPMLRLITLAPEVPGGMALIRRLVERGVRVSMGHTDADYEQARAAVKLGAKHATHTFNAMRPMHHRDPGALAAILSDDRVDAELIYDRIHVSKGAARVLVKAKGPTRVIAVSDSSAATGLAPGTRLTMWGHETVKGENDVRLASNGALAGSCITLLDAFRLLAEDFGLRTAILATSLNPRRILGMAGRPRVWVSFLPDLSEHQVYRC
ncbi:MAG: amidohydrolase family protein [Fimbriimonadaceae bacterium]|nr:amidohydrolase family protein [Fimbriimonadaceae bacterium]